jgi:NADH-quinone oxidoreductase subunit C
MLPFDQLVSFVREHCAGSDIKIDTECTPKMLAIPTENLVSLCRALFEHETTYFDMLSCLTGIDNGPQAATMEVVYNLYSIPFNHHLALKVIVPRENPEVDSVTSIWKTADWHEREAFDLVGIKFNSHPDLRRILLPADWEGHPLRKDYKQQEYYRNIKLDY